MGTGRTVEDARLILGVGARLFAVTALGSITATPSCVGARDDRLSRGCPPANPAIAFLAQHAVASAVRRRAHGGERAGGECVELRFRHARMPRFDVIQNLSASSSRIWNTPLLYRPSLTVIAVNLPFSKRPRPPS